MWFHQNVNRLSANTILFAEIKSNNKPFNNHQKMENYQQQGGQCQQPYQQAYDQQGCQQQYGAIPEAPAM